MEICKNNRVQIDFDKIGLNESQKMLLIDENFDIFEHCLGQQSSSL